MRLFKQLDTSDQKYIVFFFIGKGGELQLKFGMTDAELMHVFGLMGRPKWLRPRNFGITTNDGLMTTYIDLSQVIIIEAQESSFNAARERDIAKQNALKAQIESELPAGMKLPEGMTIQEIPRVDTPKEPESK